MENQIKELENAEFIFSDKAASQRLKRKADDTTFVVHVHTDKKIIELDADDLEHAVNLGDAWIGRHSVNYVCVRRMFKNGRLQTKSWSTDRKIY